LEGIPLALELAAARVGLAVEQIAERLDDSLRLLTTGGRTATPRQQTLRGALDWSYDLLGEPEQKLFGRLSVFASGWTLEAAETVGAGDGIEKEDVLDVLLRLVDKSLVVARTSGDGGARYRMLEPVRQYALERLKESGEVDATRSRHAVFFLALAEEAEEVTGGARQALWLERLEQEHDNFRAALSWAVDRREAELGLRLSAALGGFWFIRGYFTEGHLWLTETLENTSASAEPARAKALVYAGWLAWERGDYEQSKKFSEEALTLSRKLGDKVNTAAALYSLGTAAMIETEFERALALLEEARSLQQTLGDMVGLARTIAILGLLAMAQRDHIRAQALYEEGLPAARKANDGLAIAYALCLGAHAALIRGEHQQVKVLCEEGIKLSQEMGYKHALVLILQALPASAQAQGKPVRSARLWGAIEALRESIGVAFSPVEAYFFNPYIDAARARLDEETWQAAWAEGQAMTQEALIEYALSEEEEPASPTPPTAPDPEPTDKQLGELTAREEEVAVLAARGLTNRQIAEELIVSERTVHAHIRKSLKKLKLRSRTEIATWVADQQRVPPNPD
jgi:non-specific serine/threonine protein kinase